MTNTKKIQLLAEWQARIQTADSLIAPITDALGLSSESPTKVIAPRDGPWTTTRP